MTATLIRDVMRDLDEDLIAESEALVQRLTVAAAKRRRASFTAIIAAALLVSMLFTLGGVFALAEHGFISLPWMKESYTVESGRLISYVGSAREITVPDGVTSIASDAFDGNKYLKIINLPGSVRDIGVGCFSSCPSLEEVRVSEGSAIRSDDGMIISADGGILLFINRSEITAELVIPEGIHTLDASFNKCGVLESITLPSTLDSLGEKVFANCISLTSVDLGGVKEIGDEAFKNCGVLEDVSFPEVETVGNEAFAGCESLQYIDLRQVEVILEKAFSRTGIVYANLGESVLTIDASAFSSCKELKTIILPDTVAFIHLEAFSLTPIEAVYYKGSAEQWEEIEVNGLNLIENIRIVTDYGKDSQVGFASNGDGTCIVVPSKDRSEEGLLVIPDTSPMGETVVGIMPFRSRFGITGVVLPATVTSLPEDAFEDCRFITHVEMPGVTEIGDGAFKYCKKLESIDLSRIESIGKEAFLSCSKLESPKFSGVITEIGDEAFRHCSFSKLVLPASVSVLGERVFADIEKLESVDLSATCIERLTAVFENCTSLYEVDLPSSLKDINENTFSGCRSLREITLPDGLAEIWDDAFANTSLVRIVIPDSVKQLYFPFTNTPALKEIALGDGLVTLGGIGEGCAVEKISFGTNIRTIGISAFAGCSALTDIDIPATVTKISTEAFLDCSALKRISLPQGLTELPASCFSGCTSLESISLPSGITDIGNKCFNNCTSLSSVSIPNGVKSISERCFNACTSLSSVDLPESVTTIGKYAFINCSALTSLSLPDKIKTLSEGAFYGCSSISSLKLPNNIELIKSYTFSGCSSLTSLTLPASLKTVGDSAFDSCSSIRSLVLPATLEELGTNAFYACMGLRELTVESPETLSGGKSAFANCTSLERATLKNATHTVIPASFFNNCIALRKVEVGAAFTAEQYAFSDCSSLTDVEFDKLVEIGSYAFKNCTSLRNIEFSDELSAVSMQAFEGCTSLQTVICGKNVTGIAPDAFKNCSSLHTLRLNDSISAISSGAFEGTALKELYIPASVTSVGRAFNNSEIERLVIAAGTMRFAYSFENCKSLREVVIENADGITLQGEVFGNCISLQSVTIKEGYLSVSERCFENCAALSRIDFDRIVYIGGKAFSRCISLPSEIVFNNVISYVGYGAFSDCTGIKRVSFGINMLKTSFGIFSGCTSLTEVTLGPVLNNPIGGNVQKVYYRGTREDFERHLAANGMSFEGAEIVFDVQVPLPTGFSYTGDTVNYSGKTFSAELFTDPVAGKTQLPTDYIAGNMMGDDLYRLAKSNTHSIVYWMGAYYLVENSNLTEIK